MVTGISKFREHFVAHEDQYAIIGGTACDLLFDAAGLDFRATRDIDIVLCVEVVDAEFARAFHTFLDAGGYQARAVLDLTARSEEGANIDRKDIKKHRNDVFRLVQLVPQDARVALPEPVRRDLRAFVDLAHADENLNPKAFDVPFTRDEAADLLRTVYGLK